MIPPEKSTAVTRSLREAFGATEFEDIRMLTKGQTSSLVFRIVVNGSPFLLKIITRPYDVDTLTRMCVSMKAAAEAGLAPHVWYTSVEDRVFITDFVEEVPLPAASALVQIPATLRKLQALPPFPRVPDHLNSSCMFLMHKGPALDSFIQSVQSANILTKAESEELFTLYAQLSAVYPHQHPDLVSSHNDLFKPDNILFDGQRVWLVDWEAAFLNDRYADLAVVANLLVANAAEERNFLREYFGQEPDEYQRARFFLMQQLVHTFYALVFLLIGSAGEPLDRSEAVPESRDFHRRMWTGEINLSDKHMKVVYGRVHLERLLGNARQPRFNEALKIVSDRILENAAL
jgi:thiamine kinase-like enzyme